MKLLIVIILGLFVSVSLTLATLENPGYVLIAREPWSIEMPLTVFLVLFIVGVIGLYFLWHILIRLKNTPRDVARWRRMHRLRRSRKALSEALTSLVEGRWLQAEKHVLANVHYSETPLLFYLIAAYASQGQNKQEKRDEYLGLAHQNAPEHFLTTGMAQAQLQFFSRQYELALATLNQLRATEPKHIRVLELLAYAYRELCDWESLANLIPDMRKLKSARRETLDDLEIQAHRGLLRQSLPSGSSAVLKQAWNAVPSHLRNQPELLAVYAQHLLDQGEMDECEKLLAATIENNWHDTLVRLYGLVQSQPANRPLETAQTWLARQPDNPTLLLSLGRLARHAKQMGKAREYLEKAINLRGPIEAYQELGHLLEQVGEQNKALEYYRRALELYTRENLSMHAKAPTAMHSPRSAAGIGTAHYGY